MILALGRLALIFSLLIVASGCINAPSDSSDPSTEPNASATSPLPPISTSTASSTPNGHGSDALYLADCIGAEAVGEIPWSWGPQPPYESWRNDEPGVGDLAIVTFECQRVGFRDFERGPITFAIEHHNFVTVPQECYGGIRERVFVMARLWVDDPELAAAFHSWHGMPVVNGTIEHSEPTNGSRLQEWRLVSPDGAESRFSLPAVESENGVVSQIHAYAWPSDGGIAMLEMHRTYTKYEATVLVASGQMAPPTQWAQFAQGLPFVGRGDVMQSAVLDPRLVAYQDDLCRVPGEE
jgi:hypothetical protein